MKQHNILANKQLPNFSLSNVLRLCWICDGDKHLNECSHKDLSSPWNIFQILQNNFRNHFFFFSKAVRDSTEKKQFWKLFVAIENRSLVLSNQLFY